MRTHGWGLWIIAFLPLLAQATVCRPKDGRELVIGYSYKLDWFTTFRMKNTARGLGYKIRFQPLDKAADAATGLRQVDALLVPGGADINPRYYTSASLPPAILASIQKYQGYFVKTKEGEQRDPREFELYRTYFNHAEFATLPALGICRGMQMMAVAKGVPLVLDLNAEMNIPNRRNRFDRFEVSDASGVMGDIFPDGAGWGFKNHHQNPRMDYLTTFGAARHPELKVTATSQRGRILEAFELTDRPALGVQFHPEKSFPSVKDKVFSWLLTSACERSHHGE